MKKTLISLTLLSSITLLTGCLGGGGNPYMKSGTDKYEDVTSKVVGNWTIESYKYMGEEQIGKYYASNGKMDIDFKGKNISISLPLNEQTIQNETPKWREWAPHKGIVVNNYDINISAPWRIFDNNGRPMISLKAEGDKGGSVGTTEVNASGSGIASMEEFGAKEIGKIATITAAASAGDKLGAGKFGGSMFGDFISNAASKMAANAAEDVVGSSDYLKPSVLRPNYNIAFKGDKMILTVGRGEDSTGFTLVK